MPKEIKDEKELLRLAKDAPECEVIRTGDTVKIKIRSTKYLYTYVTDEKSSANLLKKIPCKIVEI
ncbi:MAG: hypothetical protein ACTSPY_16515 [Candidatus Helarchaeota archaeon]